MLLDILCIYSTFSTLPALKVLLSNLCYCLQQNYSLAELDEKISALKQALLRKSRETESMATRHLPWKAPLILILFFLDMCNLHIHLINCSVFINSRLTSEIKVHFHVSPLCSKQSLNIPVYFKIVNVLKVALLEFIPFCFKGGILKIENLN